MHSRYVQRVRRRYADELACLPPGVPTRELQKQALITLRERGLDMPSALRVLRQLVLERLAVLDCELQAPLAVITLAMTHLAEIALDEACKLAWAYLDELHGAPIIDPSRDSTFGTLADAAAAEPDPGPQRAQMWVVGMGKLGARELNVSSDIDLIYVYDHDGETAGNEQGRNRISNHEYFGKAVKHIYNTVGETTEHGQVFRVDLALRPNGNSGPSAVSLGALEEYFLVQGREWERFAWLKSRVIAPRASVKGGNASALRGAVLPFVFRKYLDYSVFDALRILHRQIREHATKRAAGNPGRANDVKLSRGGIREIEFTVQLLQVVRGGQFPELRTRPTLDALERLCRANLMAPATADALASAYEFLRRVEHRVQYLDDQQTHVLPTRDDDLAWLAATMGCASLCEFLHTLDAHRETVAQEFDTLLGGPSQDRCNGKGCSKATATDLPDVLPLLPEAFAAKVAAWGDHPRVQSLRDDARARLVRLIERTGAWIEEGRVTETEALRLTDWIEPLLRRESYLAMLQERPSVHERLLHLLGAAKWPARYLIKHPGVIDELASEQLLTERFDGVQFEADMEARRAALQSTGEDDEESLLDLLRRAHHAEMFRTLARDLEGVLTVEFVADDLSALADTILSTTARWCWSRLKNRHRDEPSFAIIGYGKLGGKELGYGSDLDIVFVFDDDDENAGEIYAAFVRKMINWLTVKTAEGDLFEIDTALRPNGNSGLLVTSFDAYANYQQKRGSNTAWTWEHQAMTRARPVLASPAMAERFESVRLAVITAERDAEALADEIAAMRDKVRAAHRVPSELFDVKHSVGGMVDVEFAVQYMVLAHSHAHPEMQPNLGNIKMLHRAERVGLLPPGMGTTSADAYRTLRKIQHRARLDETSTQIDPERVVQEVEAVRALWAFVLGAAHA
ncbi:bifunctional [glutamate--ammonia ligase]-adenylyl-L-tyrosine phosphorylase/[glutamate--ammonia-ligase] adenylyltransferase [Hydrogenophaga sp. PAMC20947]|uniref:bifunctional [glutamate--ammonia ligase]-adenylyl-L-tyrosine phosphorylase/[glutamate--ammonia-ligase] adenylyltransferase n=1 Tax=Hydrogenophaga sp. PAMC20947 TaxID=2565558 RepID=UPI00109DCF30|nr:bifunctional [glutamate--ammonia ligase]-adenylyl-L-tyrosine phosphorylase/[glutamate--ammonia-ligase] adenylyltransferase [Hydrogenophaga sp. PAMC20947]QCB47770.1 bifunctional [glutamate--ammonia ligase]-adenylyl-L-tyrosine phosphorylase/[glutamate--ammonia-ligase] adenylyltransferase [Hydrogenophaga sp. PAMC20947]